MREEDIYKDRESQIAAINSTFDKAKNPVSNDNIGLYKYIKQAISIY